MSTFTPQYLVFPAFPYRECDYTKGGAITDLPLTPTGQDDVYAVLLTSDQLRPNARHFGALRREHEGSVRAALHGLLSVATSQRSNRAVAHPGYESCARAQLIVRTFVPDPLNRPERFALLLQLVVGAQWAVHNPSEPNVSRSEPPPPTRASLAAGGEEKGAAAAGDADGGDGEGNNLWSTLVAAHEAGGNEEDAMATRLSHAMSKARNTVVSIFDLSAWVRDIFNPERLHRFHSCANLGHLLPETLIERSRRSQAAQQRRQGAALPQERAGPWDLLHHVSRVKETDYLRGLLSQLVLWPSAVLHGELSCDSAQAKLDEDQCTALRLACLPEFGFSDYGQLTELRVSLSLPNALATLRKWLTPEELTQYPHWCALKRYVNLDLGTHASPKDCTVVVLPAKSDSVSLSNFLLTELPSTLTARGMLERPDVQLALMQHGDLHQKLLVFESANRLGLDKDGRLWLGLCRAKLLQAQQVCGNLGLTAPLATSEALMAYVSRHIYSFRTLATEVGAVRKQLAEETEKLIDTKTAQPWERQRLLEHRLASFNAFAASGVDHNAILGMVFAFFEGGVPPEDAPMPLHIDMEAELVNFRECYGRRVYSDLTDGSAFLATLGGVATRICLGLVQYSWHAVFAQIVAGCSWLDQGERCHLQLHGDAATGKTTLVQGVEIMLPPGSAAILTHNSNAAMRDSDPTENKNRTVLRPEHGAPGEHTDLQQRALDLSRLSENRTVSKTVYFTAEGTRKILSMVNENRWSMIVATNVRTRDPAFESRFFSCHMSPLGLPGAAFGECIAGDENYRDQLQPVREAYLRATHFFWRVVMAYCMLVNAGVVDSLRSEPVSIAIVNHLLPSFTDASDIRMYKQLYTLSTMVSVMMTVHQFLASPRSPLTLVHRDRLSLAALADMRVLFRPLVAPALFVASATPFLGEDPVVRSVVEALLGTALAVTRSSVSKARRAVLEKQKHLEESEPNHYVRRQKQQQLHLEALPELFPCPVYTPPATVSRHPGAAAGAAAAAAPSPVPEAPRPPHAVFFTVDSLSNVVSAALAASDPQASRDNADRMMLYDDPDAPEDIGEPDDWADGHFLPEGVRVTLPGQDESRLLPQRPKPAKRKAPVQPPPAAGQRRMDEPDLYGPCLPAPLELLRGQDADRATHALVDELRKRIAGTTGYVATDTGAGTAARVIKSLAGTRRMQGESANDYRLRERITQVLSRLQTHVYRGGWVAVNARCLDIDTSSRVERVAQDLVQKYDVPAGGFLLYRLVHPGGKTENEAMHVVHSKRDAAHEEKHPRQTFDALLNTHQGFDTSRHKLRVAQRVYSGTAMQLEQLQQPVLCPARWNARAKEALVQSGLGTDATTRATVERVTAVLHQDVYALMASAIDESAPDARTLEDEAVRLAQNGIGLWQPGQLYAGPQRAYHDIEADPDALAAAAAAAAPAAPSLAPARKRARRETPVARKAAVAPSREEDEDDAAMERLLMGLHDATSQGAWESTLST